MRVIACALMMVVIAGGGEARAEDAHVAAARALFAAQGKAVAKDDMEALRATLTPDASVRVADNDIVAAADVSWGFPAPEKLVAKQTQIGWNGSWGWIAAEARITTRWYAEPEGAGNPHPQPETDTYHWLEVVVADGATGVKGRALFVTKVRADKELSGRDPEAAVTGGAVAALVAQPSALAAHLAADPAASVLGTGEGERGLGAAAAKMLLGTWKNLSLTLIGAPKETIAGDLGFAFADVQMRLKGKKQPFLLHALVVARKSAAGAWEIVAVSYGAD